MEDIIKIVKSLEDSGLLFKWVTETVQNKIKEKKRGCLSRLLGRIAASLLRNILSDQCMNRAEMIQIIKRAGERIVRADYGCRFSNSFALQNKTIK